MSDDDNPTPEETLLGWYNMTHYQEPRAPTPLPSAVHAQLYKILELADKIESLLLLGGEGEYSREDIMNYLHRNRSSADITAALGLLRRSGRALSSTKVRFAGHKAAEMWRLTRDS